MSKVELKIRLRAVYSTEFEYIPFKHIESINREYKSEEDVIIDKLKDDDVVRIITLSGREHLLSMKQHMGMIKDDIHTVEEMWEIIFDNWLNRVT